MAAAFVAASEEDSAAVATAVSAGVAETSRTEDSVAADVVDSADLVAAIATSAARTDSAALRPTRPVAPAGPASVEAGPATAATGGTSQEALAGVGMTREMAAAHMMTEMAEATVTATTLGGLAVTWNQSGRANPEITVGTGTETTTDRATTTAGSADLMAATKTLENYAGTRQDIDGRDCWPVLWWVLSVTDSLHSVISFRL